MLPNNNFDDIFNCTSEFIVIYTDLNYDWIES